MPRHERRLSGRVVHAIGEACTIARMLQPAMIVLEDVDLIAEERGDAPRAGNPLLFQLLNEMDGLAGDADIVFLLTTNRLDCWNRRCRATGPGRPGRECRCRTRPRANGCSQLYRGELDVDESNLDSVMGRTDGVTASFLKELPRRAALIAADADRGDGGGGRLAVSAAPQLDEALDELMATRNAMTRTLLGGRRSDRARSSAAPSWLDDAEAGPWLDDDG